MKMGLFAILCISVGWIIGVMISMVFMPMSGGIDYSFIEAIGNTFVFGFPGFVMFMIVMILSLRDDADEEF